MNYTLKDVLNVPKLQELLDSLDEVHSLPSAIIDMEGNLLTATAWQDICTKFHRMNPDTEKKCIESDLHIEAWLTENRSHFIYRCPMGLVDTATPIIIEGKHLGNVFTGQLFMEPPDESYFKEQARQYAFDEDEYLEAMRKVPIFSEQQLHKNLSFIAKLAQMLAEQGLQNLRLRKTEESLKKSEEKYYKAFKANPEAFSITSLEDGSYIEINDTFLELTGLQRNEVIGHTSRELNFWVDLNERQLFLENLSNNGSIKDFEVRYRVKNDEIRDFMVSSESIEIQGLKCGLSFIKDITERKRAEKALQKSNNLLADIIELSPISMAIVGMDGTIEQINRRAVETFGYSPDDIPNMERWWIQAYPDEAYRAKVIAQWMGLVGKAIAKKSEIERSEYRVTCKDGTVRTTLIFGIPVSDKIFVMFDDITDRKWAEEERLSLERQLLQSQKLESLGVLAGGIAHDFNNILTSIVGNTDLALRRLNPESPVIDNLKRIEKSAVRATDLAKQMLAYSGKGNFVVETIDINLLVQEMGHMLDVSISKKAILRYNLTQPLPSVEVDATQIRQVVMNLVINASEAIGERNGVITITTGCMDCDKNYLKNVVLDENIKAGRYVYLEIADTGCGMDKETIAKVFDPFFTTKFTGRGLGMAAVQGIVRSHKGIISFYSEPDKGTTFKVFLPASDKLVENVDDQPHKDDWRGEGKVLLVDDEETVRDIGTEMLQELGFAVITASDGNEAIEKFKAIPDVAFVILDLTMPQMGGEECFRELKQLKSDLKVVMSSGFSEQEVSQKFAGRGMAGFIHKPYKLTVLKEAIARLVVPDL